MSTPELDAWDIARYSRHLLLDEVGVAGQRKLKGASVLCVGTGGLGSPLLLYLAAAGVGRIGIVDFDTVDASNLQRQIIHGTANIGKPKLHSARDRILDIKDACPLAAEVYNEVNDEDGCPDELPPPPPPEIERFTGVIRGINFKVNSDQITVDSYALLDEAAAVFIKYPSLRIEVAGHTDSDGAAEKNLDLSARRAKAVVTYLIRRGVPPDRLEWVGFGESAPLVDNKSPDGKAVNRRVEFHVLQN
jgi:outer membrane protein OmpA-like peptidoglycan-associated protein